MFRTILVKDWNSRCRLRPALSNKQSKKHIHLLTPRPHEGSVRVPSMPRPRSMEDDRSRQVIIALNLPIFCSPSPF